MTVINSSTAVSGSFRVSGLAELQAAMKALPQKIETNILRGAVRAGANIIAEDARRRCPVDTGQLKASIRVSIRVENGRVKAFVKAGSRYRVFAIGKKGKRTTAPYRTAKAGGGVDYHAAFYPHFIEFGTAKMAAKPFMRPAFESRKVAAVEAMRDYIRQRLAREFGK